MRAGSRRSSAGSSRRASPAIRGTDCAPPGPAARSAANAARTRDARCFIVLMRYQAAARESGATALAILSGVATLILETTAVQVDAAAPRRISFRLFSIKFNLVRQPLLCHRRMLSQRRGMLRHNDTLAPGHGAMPTTTGGITGPTSALTAPAGVPTARAGSHNVVIDVSAANPGIIWLGDGDGEFGGAASTRMGYTFTGSAVFVSIAWNNADYGISVDDDDTLYTGDADASALKNCTFSWQRTNLGSGSHFLLIDPLGSQVGGPDINGPCITQPGPNPAASSDNIQPTPDSDHGSGSGSGSGFGSLGAARKNSFSLLFTAVMIFVATMLVYLL
ncbi:hypothetical protein GGX14DRAFT_396720 [Mycena pura]|uniref:Uncharacterized protein n=1 Tax=Mycena pura TaxID=153505 RepID=A0AAD6V9U5_9AGAR|nr:hypothetical protein GGX14DRAFT_396720 [Mycena pura]